MSTNLFRLLLCTSLLSFSSSVFSHAGKVDINGGHYYGQSYHCHLSGCVMPDTFTRYGIDSLLTDHREREKFFNEVDWDYEQDFDNDCQSTRQEMLVLTSRSEVRYTNPRNCVVRIGEWLDEYTGKTFNVATQLDLDHVVPLMYAHTHGGDAWPPGKKLQFANDPLNLVLVDRREIRRKRDRGPSRYLPREEFQCEYVRIWQAVADKYDFVIEGPDRSRISRVLDECESDADTVDNDN